MVAIAATVTRRGVRTEWADWSTACKGKNGLCDPAQWLMWDAKSAASVDTKSADKKSDPAEDGLAWMFKVSMVGALPEKLP